MTTVYETLRLPRSLWENLEEATILWDRQFLTEVARSLGLPPAEVIRKVLGTGAPASVPVLWTTTAAGPAPAACPWWECHGDGLWRRCPRVRLSPTLPCCVHERCTPCPLARLDSDPFIKALPVLWPVRRQGTLFWADPNGEAFPFHEDGRLETGGRFRFSEHRGKRIALWIPVAKPQVEETETPDDSETE